MTRKRVLNEMDKLFFAGAGIASYILMHLIMNIL